VTGQVGRGEVQVEPYWTPGRVKFWLRRYVDLRRAVRYGCAVDAMGEDAGMMRGQRTNRYTDLAGHLLCVKCDLDMAVRRLTGRRREVVLLHFGGGVGQVALARRYGISQAVVSREIQKAVRSMAKWLGWGGS